MALNIRIKYNGPYHFPTACCHSNGPECTILHAILRSKCMRDVTEHVGTFDVVSLYTNVDMEEAITGDTSLEYARGTSCVYTGSRWKTCGNYSTWSWITTSFAARKHTLSKFEALPWATGWVGPWQLSAWTSLIATISKMNLNERSTLGMWTTLVQWWRQ